MNEIIIRATSRDKVGVGHVIVGPHGAVEANYTWQFSWRISASTVASSALIVRGLRAVVDFEYEFQMTGMNQQLNADIETVFFMADVALQPIASKLVKEIAMYGGDIHKFVTPGGEAQVMARVREIGLKGDKEP